MVKQAFLLYGNAFFRNLQKYSTSAENQALRQKRLNLLFYLWNSPAVRPNNTVMRYLLADGAQVLSKPCPNRMSLFALSLLYLRNYFLGPNLYTFSPPTFKSSKMHINSALCFKMFLSPLFLCTLKTYFSVILFLSFRPPPLWRGEGFGTSCPLLSFWRRPESCKVHS